MMTLIVLRLTKQEAIINNRIRIANLRQKY
ncbi:MAG: hypothetical protein ACI9O3_000845 [Colwellia sp.]|jgi:hypothetical protein